MGILDTLMGGGRHGEVMREQNKRDTIKWAIEKEKAIETRTKLLPHIDEAKNNVLKKLHSNIKQADKIKCLEIQTLLDQYERETRQETRLGGLRSTMRSLYSIYDELDKMTENRKLTVERIDIQSDPKDLRDEERKIRRQRDRAETSSPYKALLKSHNC